MRPRMIQAFVQIQLKIGCMHQESIVLNVLNACRGKRFIWCGYATGHALPENWRFISGTDMDAEAALAQVHYSVE